MLVHTLVFCPRVHWSLIGFYRHQQLLMFPFIPVSLVLALARYPYLIISVIWTELFFVGMIWSRPS